MFQEYGIAAHHSNVDVQRFSMGIQRMKATIAEGATGYGFGAGKNEKAGLLRTLGLDPAELADDGR